MAERYGPHPSVLICGMSPNGPGWLHPAMVAGLTDTLWSMDEFYDNVMEHDRQWRQRQRNQPFVDRQRGE